MEARIDGFCYVWYDGIVDQHVRVKLNGCIFLTTIKGLAIQHGSCGTPVIWCSGAN